MNQGLNNLKFMFSFATDYKSKLTDLLDLYLKFKSKK
jgi:hypothetical protein